ncbi:MAG TPA: hypothetical protein VM619_14760 [Luteimonas sp.]|nr:hypothetical protein [Luteimonas sp.]
MANPTDHIANRIRQWAIEAGGDQLKRLGYAAIEAIRNTAAANDPDYSADGAHIAAILERMHADGRWKEVRVLRVHYLAAGLTEGERIQRLRRDGLSVSRAAYYIYLDAAHAYVAGAIAFGDHPCES